MSKTTNLEILRKSPERYTWGDLTHIHDIGEYSIVQSIDTFGDEPDYGTDYHPYVYGKDLSRGFTTLDEALVYAIAYKHEQNHNIQAHTYFMRAVTGDNY